MVKGEHSFCADDKATHRFDAIIVVTQRGACNRVSVSFAGKSSFRRHDDALETGHLSSMSRLHSEHQERCTLLIFGRFH